MSEPPGSRRVWKLLALVLVALGLATSGYLLARHFALAGGSELFDICQAVFGGDCDAAIGSDLAVQLGIPLAGWGIVLELTLAAALLMAFRLGDAFANAGTLVALTLCTAATVAGGVLTFLMLSGATAFCPLCLAVHVINLLLIPVIFLASGHTIRQLAVAAGQGIGYVFGAAAEDPTKVRWKVTGLVTVALVGVVAYQWVLIQTDRHAVAEGDAPVTFERVLAEFEAAPPREIRTSDEDPRRGTAGANLQLVVFSDFQCPACVRFAQIVREVEDRHPELAVVFKHYPLGKACNPGVRFDLHPQSCAAADAAEAARRQGKFWEFHDAVFAAGQPLETDVLAKTAEDLGLDRSRFDADLADPGTKEKVQADIALGRQLKIRGTPSAFLNGKPLSTRAMMMLDQLVDHLATDGHEHAHDDHAHDE